MYICMYFWLVQSIGQIRQKINFIYKLEELETVRFIDLHFKYFILILI